MDRSQGTELPQLGNRVRYQQSLSGERVCVEPKKEDRTILFFFLKKGENKHIGKFQHARIFLCCSRESNLVQKEINL